MKGELIQMEFIPYKANECFEHLYYQIPMELFFNPKYKDKLNSDSKILYGFLLNRLALSKKNNWFDEEGNVFLIFTRKEVQEKLGLCDRTVTKAFKQLTNAKLIYEKRQGANKPNLIYVGKIQHMDIKNWTRKNFNSRVEENTIQDAKNIRPINTNNNYTYINNKANKNSNRYFGRNYSTEFLEGLYANL